MILVFLFYFTIGALEYFRVVEDYQKHLEEEYPIHPILLLNFCILVVCLLFGLPLLIIKIFTHMKIFFKNLWRKITLPFRLIRFGKKLNKSTQEKDSKKSIELLFEALREILK
jgi:Na+/H+ antiporter NhaC|tara:strand:- start:294 stop:632 length:339 start_codon:yes stop_codon:yes gene_type:complete